MVVQPRPSKPQRAKTGTVHLDPALQFRDPRLPDLLAYWESRKNGRELPKRSDFRPSDMVAHLPNLILVDVQEEPLRLRYRLIGTAITTAMQRDSTGRWYDELYGPELLENILASFRWILAHRAPLRSHGTAFYPDRNFYDYEVLNLPLSEDGRRINMVLGELVFQATAADR